MRRLIPIALIFLAGCGQPPATPQAAATTVETIAPEQGTEQLRELARVAWQHETKRLKEREVYVSTDPEAWGIVASARTLRMLVVGDSDDVETLLPVMLTTDAAFWRSDEMPDSSITQLGDAITSYRAAVLICEQKLRLRGMNELADKLQGLTLN